MATYPSPILQDVTVEGALTGPGVDAVVAPLLTSATAASTYETQTSAASTYETQANATATYETIASAASTYTAQADLASTATGKGSRLVAWIRRVTGAVARWVEDKLAESISVDDFGALGDGTADDAAAIQLAVNYITSLTYGAKIKFTTGKTYLAGATVNWPTTANTRQIIDGYGASVGRHGSFTGSLFYIGQATNAVSAPPVLVKGIQFFGPYLTPTVFALVSVQNSNGINFVDCSFASGTSAVGLASVYAAVFTRCKFTYQSQYGIICSTAINSLTVDACQFSSIGASGPGSDIYLAAAANNVNILNNDMEGGNQAIIFNAGVNALQFRGNYVESKANLPIYFGAASSAICIDGNWIGYNTTSQTWYNITGGQLTNNIFYNQAQAVDPSCQDFEIGNNAYAGTSAPIYRAWTSPAFTNGFTNTGTPWELAGYTKSSDGMVSVHGMVQAAADGAAFVLPAGYRPSASMLFGAVGSAAGVAHIVVDVNGNVIVYRAADTTCDLGVVRFIAGA